MILHICSRDIWDYVDRSNWHVDLCCTKEGRCLIHQTYVGSSTDIIVTGWTVMRNILENPQEHLGKGSGNT